MPSLFRSRLLPLLALAGLALVAGCRSTPLPPFIWAITGTVWKVVEIDGEMVGTSHIPTIQLEPDGSRVIGFAGVNRFNGTYTLSENRLGFGPMAATKMSGPPPEMKLEQRYLELLGKVTHFRAADQWLILLAGDTVVARAQATPALPFDPNSSFPIRH